MKKAAPKKAFFYYLQKSSIPMTACALLWAASSAATPYYYVVNTSPATVYVGIFSVAGTTLTDFTTRKMYKLGPGMGVSKPYAEFRLPINSSMADQRFIFATSDELDDIKTMLKDGTLHANAKILLQPLKPQAVVYEIKKDVTSPLIVGSSSLKQWFIKMEPVLEEQKPAGVKVPESAEMNLKEQKRVAAEYERLKKERDEQDKSSQGGTIRFTEQREQAPAMQEIEGVSFHMPSSPRVSTFGEGGAYKQSVRSSKSWSKNKSKR